jgi:hypothetical protein
MSSGSLQRKLEQEGDEMPKQFFNALFVHLSDISSFLNSFGDVYMGRNVKTGEKVAIKVESIHSRCPQLKHEAKVVYIFVSSTECPTAQLSSLYQTNACSIITLQASPLSTTPSPLKVYKYLSRGNAGRHQK